MRTTMFALALALLAVPNVPRSARAAAVQTVGCAAVGYTMQVPIGWVVNHLCATKAIIMQIGGPTILVVTVERHGWWSDARSKSSIGNDIAAQNTSPLSMRPLTFSIVTIAGRRFFAGMGIVRDQLRLEHVEMEMETFGAGHMYKFAADIPMGNTRVDHASISGVRRIWATIRIGVTG